MKRALAAILTLCLLLSGCSWMEGNYHSVTPHMQHSSDSQSTVLVAQNYLELRRALENLIRSGMENCVISTGNFQDGQLENCMDIAVRYIKSTFPIGAYAVEDISYELGTSGGVEAVAVNITYLHQRSEIQQILTVGSMEEAKTQIQTAMTNYETGLVMLVDNYKSEDLQQFAEDYAAQMPGLLMETPVITAQTYPNAGSKRVLEVKFTYQTSRETLRTMQEQVRRMFASASLYVSPDAQESQKFAQLYAFLMERFPEYQVKTSITPAYSLLNHGVGDSKAFANVYAQMCREAGLECLSVLGTRNGEPWFWNIVRVDGYYYHVDLLTAQGSGGYQEWTDAQMENYVWDYSAYPACTGAPGPIGPEEPGEADPGTPETQPPTEASENPPSTEQTAPNTLPPETGDTKEIPET